MIERLRIRGLGIIDDATIEFAPGLTAITGETGAGKTMVLSGLALLMGERADGGLVRRGADAAWIDGDWQVGADHRVVARLEDAGAECEPDGPGRVRVILGRTIAAEGRSRATAGGRSVPVGVLADVAGDLVAVHGQSDQLLLRSGPAQRDVLDRFGGPDLLQALADFRSAFDHWRSVGAELAELTATRQSRDQRAAELAIGIAEIEAVAPTPGEDAALEREAARMLHSGTLVEQVQIAHDAIAGVESAESAAGALDALAAAEHALDRAIALDDSLIAVKAQVHEAVVVLGDAAAELAAYATGIDADPLHRDRVEERRAALATLRRRYGSTVEEILQWLQEARATVAEVGGDDARLEALAAEVSVALDRMSACSAKLTAERRGAAERFSAAVTAELDALAMPDAQIRVDVQTETDPHRWGATGADRVELLLRPHRGGEFRPLAKSASGGELSRVMLAIEVVLAGSDPVATFVFDEVDAGIGGRAAVEVGRRLARLSRAAQVIVVTHLPQVAAFADMQVVVAKDSGGLVTQAEVGAVTGAQRVGELVRMLSGLDGSASGQAHAEELLQLASVERGSDEGGSVEGGSVERGSVSGESRVRGRRQR